MVMPWMPSSVRASFTSASLNGLIIASIFFMAVSWQGTKVQSSDRLRPQCDTSPAASRRGAALVVWLPPGHESHALPPSALSPRFLAKPPRRARVGDEGARSNVGGQLTHGGSSSAVGGKSLRGKKRRSGEDSEAGARR